MADDHGAAGEVLERLLQRPQRIDVEVVGRLVEQQQVGARLQHLGEMHAVALAARQHADLLLLVAALEVEGRAIGARVDLALAEVDHVVAAGDLLPDGLLVVERVARLVDIAELDRRADDDRAGIGLFLPGDHAEQRRLAGAVRPDDADDPARRQLERQVLDQHAVAEALRQVLEVDDVVAQPLRHRDDDLRRARPLVVLLRDEVLVALDAGLGLGLARLGRCRHPLALALQRALAGLLLAPLLLQPLLLLLQPGRVVALVRNTAAAVELEDPAGDIVEEVAVMGNDQDRARIGPQMAFQPVHRLGIEMVGRLVEQQHLGLRQQQLAQRDAALFAARQLRHVGVVGWAAQRVHRLVDLAVEIPQALGLDLVLQLHHLVGGVVRVVHGEIVVARQDRLLRRHAQHDVLAHAQLLVELRLLRQVADARTLGDEAVADELLVDPRHDAQQGRLARAVDAEHADLGRRVERQVDVVEDLLAARIGLGETLHVIDVLVGGHGRLLSCWRGRVSCCRHM